MKGPEYEEMRKIALREITKHVKVPQDVKESERIGWVMQNSSITSYSHPFDRWPYFVFVNIDKRTFVASMYDTNHTSLGKYDTDLHYAKSRKNEKFLGEPGQEKTYRWFIIEQ